MAPANTTKDYYAILELSTSADLKSIRASYRKLALLRHPDRNKSVTATRDFQLLQEAYSALSDPDKRQQYDRTYTPTKAGRHTSSSPFSSSAPSTPFSSGSTSTPADAARLSRRRTLEEKLQRQRAERVTQYNDIWEEKRAIRRMQDEIDRLQSKFDEEQAQEEKEKGFYGYVNWLRGMKMASPEEKLDRERRQLDRKNAVRIKRLQLDMKKGNLAGLERTLETIDRDIDRVHGQIEAIDRDIQMEREMKRQAEEAERRRKEEAERWKQAEELARKRRAEADAARRREAEEARRAEELKKTMYSFFQGMEEEGGKGSRTICRHAGWWTKVGSFGRCSECSRVMKRFHFSCPGCKKVACASCRDRLKRPGAPYWSDDDYS